MTAVRSVRIARASPHYQRCIVPNSRVKLREPCLVLCHLTEDWLSLAHCRPSHALWLGCELSERPCSSAALGVLKLYTASGKKRAAIESWLAYSAPRNTPYCTPISGCTSYIASTTPSSPHILQLTHHSSHVACNVVSHTTRPRRG